MTPFRWAVALAAGSALVLLLCLCGGLLVWQARPLFTSSLTPTPAVVRATAPAATRTALPTATARVAETATVVTEASPLPATPPPLSPTPDETLRSTLEAVMGTTLPVRDLYDLAIRFGRIDASTPRVVRESDPGYTMGDTLTFTVSNLAESQTFQVEATLRAQSDHASWWVESSATVNQTDLEASARVFEEETYPTNRSLFGSEWSPGVDGDLRVHIFLGEVPGVGGYYSSADEFPRTVNPNSNEKEIFYLNLNNAQPGNDYFDGILAHEFQHMIHWNVDPNEELWINEGLSELAAELNGFEVGSGADAYIRDPDIPVTRWSDQSHPFYGSAFLFLNYFYQRFGQKALTGLVQNEADGQQGFNSALAPYTVTFDELFSDWTVANLLNDSTLQDGRFGYNGERLRAPTPALTVDEYPTVERGDVFQYGTDYITLEAERQAGTLTIEFMGDTSVALLPTQAQGGAWMLWSHRGDDTHTSISRAFDLSGLTQATLRFWTWHDLEPNYDYAYVALSTDGGERWQLLPATTTVETNPHGNSFGPAFTGKSGHAPDADESAESRWQEQVVDLTPFVGQEVLLSFHTITDDALNHNGFVVDDVSIPELGYSEGFEGGAGGWKGAGFVRVDNLLPQRFLVRAVAEGSAEPRILPVTLDASNHATLTVPDFGSSIERVTLIVTGATSFTSERTGYGLIARLQR